MNAQAQVIFNGDDFGRSMAVNRAILRAHTQGVLTSASLMVTGAGFEDAVARARQTPSLAVGLHLVLINGQSVLPQDHIPHLVDANRRFRNDPFQAGVLYFFSRAARAELAREISAQFERFAQTGLNLSHVDGHEHLHLHPVAFQMLLPLASRFGAAGIRLPQDDFWLAVRYDAHALGQKALWAVVFAVLVRWCRRQARGYGLVSPPAVYGLMQSGSMQAAYVIRALQQLHTPLAEFYFHPTCDAHGERLGPNHTDLDALLDDGVRAVIHNRHIQPVSYLQARHLGEHKRYDHQPAG